jgi:hypothetical protein
MAKSSVKAPPLDEAQSAIATRERQALGAVRERSTVPSRASSAPLALHENLRSSVVGRQWLWDLLQGDTPAPRTLVDIFTSSVERWPRHGPPGQGAKSELRGTR